MQPYRTSLFGNLPPIIRTLLIINIIVFIADQGLKRLMGIDISPVFALHNFQSEYFKPIQLVTYLFMHGDIWHIFFNMFAFVMFGRILESVWGAKRFAIFFFVTGIGAALVQQLVNYISLTGIQNEIMVYLNSPSPEALMQMVRGHSLTGVNDFLTSYSSMPDNPLYIQKGMDIARSVYYVYLNTATVGASGAVFGVLLAFGMMFPNMQLMLIFPPIPIKAKWMVIAYGAIELFAVIMPQQGDNVAHFAHLGGMLFGFFLIRYWNKKGNKPYNYY
jgi:membrane associated rhomboid family serine protease